MTSNNYETCNTVISYQLNAVISIGGNSNTVNILTFDSTLVNNMIPDNNLTPTGCVIIEKPGLGTNGLVALISNRHPRILAFNRTGVTANGIPAYSVAVEIWDNTYTISEGDLVTFAPATNTIPAQVEEYGNGVFLFSSLYEADNLSKPTLSDIRRLKAQFATISEFDQTALLLNQSTIKSGIDMTTPSQGELSVSSGVIEYKGIEYTFPGANSTPAAKNLYQAYVNDSLMLTTESDTSGSVINNYTCTALPSASGWTGTYTEYTLNNVAGSSANGAIIETILQTATPNLFLEIDFGGGSTKERVYINSERVLLESNQIAYKLDTSPVHIRLVVNDSSSHVYINSYLALSSDSPGAGSSNKFAFGSATAISENIADNMLELASPSGTIKISKVVCKTNTISAPSFEAADGAFVGVLCKDAQEIGLSNDLNFSLGRKEGNIRQTNDTRAYSAWLGNGSETSFSVIHNLNTKNIHVSLTDSSGESYLFGYTIDNENTINISFSIAPSMLEYKVNIVAV